MDCTMQVIKKQWQQPSSSVPGKTLMSSPIATFLEQKGGLATHTHTPLDISEGNSFHSECYVGHL